jgi:hypothetical protein
MISFRRLWLSLSSVSEAAFFWLPRALKYHFSQILFDTPAVSPHTRFCLRYPDECEVRGIDFQKTIIPRVTAVSDI